MNIAFVDLETGGLDPLTHDIIEFGVVIFNLHDFSVVETWEQKVIPTRPLDPEAVAVNGYSEAEWQEAIPLETALLTFTEKTKDCTLMAHNLHFDLGFLEAASRLTSLELTFGHRNRYDLLSIAWALLPRYTLRSYSLKNICTHLGIPPEDDVHRALAGALAGYKVFATLMK